MSYQQVASGQTNPEVPINENMAALGQEFTFSHDVTHDSGLVVGISGGNFDGNTVADTTVTGTDNTTNYIVGHRTTRAISSSTVTTNWNNTATYGRIARAVFASGVLSFYDERSSLGGIFDHAAALGAGDVVGPGSATDSHLAQFDGTTGKLIKDGGLSLDTDGTLAANSATRVPSQSAVVSYVATQLDGRSWKQRVRAATTANGTLATAFANGQTIDGVTLATGDRILLKDQSTGADNGIYVVASSGAPARSSDADTGAELVNATVEVSEGTANADLQYTCSTNAPITVGVTSLVFVLTSSSTTYTADESTLHLSGAQFSLKAGAVGIDTHAASAKTTPVDADEMPLTDSASSFVLKKVTWANIKATLKTYLDTLYAPLAQPFDVFAFLPGLQTSASQKILRVKLARTVTFAANFGGSYFAGAASATSTTVFDVQKNGSSIGSISIAAAGTTATFTTSGGTSQAFAAGDLLAIIGPATADATLADMGFTLVGTR